MAKRDTTTKDISLLQQLYEEDQLTLAPEFQRESVWPRPAKAYLIDTILNDRPIPLLFFQRTINPQTSRPAYSVVDGQQRLRAIFEFLRDEFPLPDDTDDAFAGKRFSSLSSRHRQRILNYDLSVVELHGYKEPDVRDVFVRMNKYVVKLSRQELRHARSDGAFKKLVEEIVAWDFWSENNVFTTQQRQRMRDAEFVAELVILLTEGPQDKKHSLDLYYGEYQKRFPYRTYVVNQLREYVDWLSEAMPALGTSRFRRPVDLYGVLGALADVTEGGLNWGGMDPGAAGAALQRFERELKASRRSRDAHRYAAAVSRQTDNLIPRETRIEILSNLLLN